VPYITPQDIPEDGACRSLLIPASSEWLAFFGGALTEFIYAYNWEQTTGISVEDTIAKMREIIAGFYEGCQSCELPGGGAVIRINLSGKIEIIQDGEWVEPTEGSDYYIPPPEAREGGTTDDQICLAAKNAVNVLHQLYDNLSDSFSDDLDEAAAGLLFVEAIVSVIGIALASISAGILALGLFGFQLLYQAISYLTADLWTEAFESQITCFLIACASNDAGVVTFDWECFNEKLNSLANDFSLSEVQIRLYLQVGFILQFIGGADGLNLAGATTAITDDDCTFCDDCVRYDFTLSDEGWVADTYGTWVDGEGWQLNSSPSAIMFGFDGIPFPTHISSVSVEYYNSGGTGVMALYKNTGSYVAVTVGEPLLNGENEFLMYGVADTGEIPNIFFNANADEGATVYIRALTICYL